LYSSGNGTNQQLTRRKRGRSVNVVPDSSRPFIVGHLGKKNPDKPAAQKENSMTPEELGNIANELKRLGGELNLSDSQKEQLRTFLTDKYEQLQEYRKNNPNISKDDIAQYIAKNRAAGREKLEKFLTPEQLKTWDAEVAKAKDFLSQRAATA
jgi:hypothetical protein